MVQFRLLLVSAVLAVALAAVGVTAVMSALNPTAGEVASGSAGSDPLIPPAFYGSR